MEKKNLFIKAILMVIGIGIWAIVLQNGGVIPTNQKVYVVNTVDTYVNGGSIDAEVSGSVDIYNTVDVNLEEILGYKAGTRRSYVIDGVQYNSLDVSQR